MTEVQVARLSAAKRALVERALLNRKRTTRIPRRPADASIPLTYAQRGMWFLDQWQPDSALYGVRSAFRLTGPLDVNALQGAFQELVRRHEILRTTFVSVDGRPVQVVSPDASITVDVRDDSVDSLREAEAARSFDLARGPMLRATLVVTGENEHVLLVSLHHIVADGWSYSLLIQELSALYAGRELPELPLQYGDFAVWQAQNLPAKDLAWWQDLLAGSPRLLTLPTDRPRPAVLSYRGGTRDFTVASPVAAALRELGQREGVTLFMTLLAAFKTLLHRYTGDVDLVVGCPVAGRNDRDLERLIGCFLNTLALRTDLGGDPSFLSLLGRVKQGTLAAYAHQDVPFEWLVEELRLGRNTSHTPVFQVMFAMENTLPADWHLPGIDVSVLPVSHPAESFDLSMAMSESPTGLVGTLSYSADLFDEGTIARLVDHFAALLGAIADDPSRRLSGYPVGELGGKRHHEAATAVSERSYDTGVLHGIWCEVLGVEEIDADADFFEAGGHSLLAVQVMARVRKALGVDLPVRALFEAPTLNTFAHQVYSGWHKAALPAISAVERTGPVALSHAQRRLWFTDLLDRSGSHHNVATALTIDGDLDVAALRRAVNEVRSRHESLRATFLQSVSQVVQPYSPVPAPVIDLSGLADAAEVASALAQAEATRPFDLEHGPVLRVNLLRLGTSRHVLLVTIHHIVTDAWSTALFFEELWEAYSGATLPPVAIQYADYAAWEQRWLTPNALAKADDYWRAQLAGAPATLDLNFDQPHPATPVFSSATLPYALSTSETEALVEFGLSENVTLFVTVLTAYLIVLHRRAEQTDIVLGTGIANRGSVEVERVIGFFTNQIVLRTPVNGSDTLRSLLARVREVTLGAYAHQEMPFDRLVELLQPPRLVNRPPLFQVEIEYHRSPDQPPAPDGLTIAPQERHSPTTTLDLSLHVVQTETVVRGGLVYNADVFAPATARRMLGEWRTLLTAMIRNPDSSMDTVDSLAAAAEEEWRKSAARDRAAAARARFDSVKRR
jgi:non-ribosomal peptide synthetase component F/acyl carrier protein